MRSKLKDLIINYKELDLIEVVEPEGMKLKPIIRIYRGTYLFTQVEVKVIPLNSLDLDQLVTFFMIPEMLTII